MEQLSQVSWSAARIEVIDLGAAAEAVGEYDGGRVTSEGGRERERGDVHRGLVVDGLESEVPGEAAAADRLMQLGDPLPAEIVRLRWGSEGGVLVTVGLQDRLG